MNEAEAISKAYEAGYDKGFNDGYEEGLRDGKGAVSKGEGGEMNYLIVFLICFILCGCEQTVTHTVPSQITFMSNGKKYELLVMPHTVKKLANGHISYDARFVAVVDKARNVENDERRTSEPTIPR